MKANQPLPDNCIVESVGNQKAQGKILRWKTFYILIAVVNAFVYSINYLIWVNLNDTSINLLVELCHLNPPTLLCGNVITRASGHDFTATVKRSLTLGMSSNAGGLLLCKHGHLHAMITMGIRLCEGFYKEHEDAQPKRIV